MAETSHTRSILSKVLFIGGIIIILVLLAWAIISFVPAIFSSLSGAGSYFKNLGKTGGDITVLTNDNDLATGDRFSAYWQFSPTEAGTYSITHECVNGASFDIHIGTETKRLICNTPLSLPANTVNVELTAYNGNTNTFVDVPIKVYYTVTGENAPQYNGETTVTVRNGNASVAENGAPTSGTLSSATITSQPVSSGSTQTSGSQTGTQTSGSTQAQPMSVVNTPTYTYNAPTGRADLAISNIYSIPGQSALQFDVYNIGGGTTGIWQFAYSDPSQGGKTQYSPAQISLGAGQGIRFTLSFSGQSRTNETVALFVDPANIVAENSESNNTASVVVTGRVTGSNGNTGGSSNGDYNSNDDADLVFDELEVGYLSGNNFREDDELDEGDDAAIRFEVRNKGGENSGSWRFEVTNMPFDDDDDYQSPSQASLRPGEIRVVTLEFENIDEGTYSIRVELDSRDDVDEESESNNTKTVRLDVEN